MNKRIIPTILFATVFSTYLITLSPSVWIGGDSGEVITAGAVAGIMHPPGYPLNTILAILFARLPFGPSIAWRVNLMSAVFQSLTVVLVYLIIKEILSLVELHQDKNPHNLKFDTWILEFSALFATLALAFSSLFWFYALVAEVFALNTFLALLFIYFLIVWHKQNHPKHLFAASLIGGLGMSNHYTFVFILLAGIVFIFRSLREKAREAENPQVPTLTDGANWVCGRIINLHNRIRSCPELVAFFFFLFALLTYLYLPIRGAQNPSLKWGTPETLNGFIRLVTRADYGVFTATVGGVTEQSTFLKIMEREQKFFEQGLLKNIFWPGIFVSSIGLIVLLKRWRKPISLLFLLSFFGAGFFFLGYLNLPTSTLHGLGMIERFYLLPLALSCILLGVGLSWVFRISRRFRTPLAILFCIGVLVLGINNFSKVNMSNYYLAEDFMENVFNSINENDLLLANGDGPIFTTLYLDLGENKIDQTYLTLGILGADWYTQQIKQKYNQDFHLPDQSQKISLEEFTQNNYQEYDLYTNSNDDPSLAQSQKFGFLPYGLVYKIQEKDVVVDNQTYIEKNKLLWDSYQFRNLKLIDEHFSIFDQELVSDIATAHFNLGAIYDQIELDDLAVEQYQKAIEINPHRPQFASNLALILALQDQIVEAEEVLLKAEQNINYLSKVEEIEALYRNLVLFYSEVKPEAEKVRTYQEKLLKHSKS